MISKNLNEFIKKLSQQDKKTLSQKALKVAEESGELAKVILPFDNAEGTLHRFTDRDKILEEVADVYLTSMSIAYSLDFSDEEIENMIRKKSEKWQEIQSKESEVKFPIPYEIHVTVKIPDEELNWYAPSNVDFFKVTCKNMGVKPIVLDLENNENNIIDVMTSSHFFGDNRTVLHELSRIIHQLTKNGFEVVREKIETVPWHPAAPSEKGHIKDMPDNCYFESHIGVFIYDKEGKNQLNHVASQFGAHLSKNFFKKNEDGSYINMVTLRSYEGTYEQFLEKHNQLLDVIKSQFNIEEKPIIEFAIYDTKISHDFLWQNKEKQKDENCV